jgi:uncharacterized membrane protein YdjX (TVP38/TMEM64 family)
LTRNRQRLLVAVGWAALLAGYVAFTRDRGLSALEAAEELRGALADHWWGPVLFVVVYTVRPLVLFPASILTVLGGLAFGPVWGTCWTLLAANLSTATTYLLGRTFGSPDAAGRMSRLLGDLVDRARRNPFETTLLMRLLYLPFDAVGYVAGFVHLRFVPFLAGSALGIVPGTVAFVGFGASIDSLDEGNPSFDLRILAASIVLAVAGTLLSRWLRARRPLAATAATDELEASP